MRSSDRNSRGLIDALTKLHFVRDCHFKCLGCLVSACADDPAATAEPSKAGTKTRADAGDDRDMKILEEVCGCMQSVRVERVWDADRISHGPFSP